MRKKKAAKTIQTPQLTAKDLLRKAEEEVAHLAIPCNPYDQHNIVLNGLKEYRQKVKNNEKKIAPSDLSYQMLTLYEFENSLLLAGGFQESMRVLVTDLSAKLKSEYKCKTTSEKATAHLVAQNFVRTLELQNHINMQLNRETFNDMTLRRLSILEKAYDRANRQYLLSLHELRTSKLPPMNLKLVTQNAMFGQNQQVVNEAESRSTADGEFINAK